MGLLGETDTSRLLKKKAGSSACGLLPQGRFSNLKLFQKDFLSWSNEQANCVLCTLQEIKKKNPKEKHRFTRKTQAHGYLFLIQVGL